MRALIPFALGLALICAGLGYLALSRGGEVATAEPVPGESKVGCSFGPVPEPVPEDRSGPIDAAQPVPPSAVATGAVPAAGLEDGALAANGAPAGDFAWQYRKSTPEEMSLRMQQLDVLVKAEQDRLFAARFENGQFERQLLDPQSSASWDLFKEQPPPGEVARGVIVDLPAKRDAQGQPLPREREVHHATLPRAEYPEFYARFDEWSWLRRELARAEEAARRDGR
jgi:hypothetical protein